MFYDPKIHHRQSIRLPLYDYSKNGAYFITICSHKRKNIFGEIIEEKIELSDIGKLIQKEWFRTTEIRKNISLDAFVVMPNHIHGIIVIKFQICRGTVHRAPTTEQFSIPTANSIPTILRSFKATVTCQINTMRIQKNLPPLRIWQRNYHERIIRNEASFFMIREYIHNNPKTWQKDCFFEE